MTRLAILCTLALLASACATNPSVHSLGLAAPDNSALLLMSDDDRAG